MTDQGETKGARTGVGNDFWLELAALTAATRGAMSHEDMMIACAKIGLDVLACQAHEAGAHTALARARVALTVARGSVVQGAADLIPMHDAVIEADPEAWEAEKREALVDISTAPVPGQEQAKPH